MLSLKKLELILKHLEPILKAEDDQLKEDMGDGYTKGDKDTLVDMVNNYEKKLVKAFNKEKKRVKKYVSEFVGKDVSLKALMAYIVAQMSEDDKLQKEIEKINSAELLADMGAITPVIMDMIDKDVAFNTFSKKTTDWVDSWSKELGDLMKITTSDEVDRTLKRGLKEGWSIDDVSRELEQLPSFSRARARTTAITEVLTAHSASHYEAYLQSPAVVGKTWKHSGARKNRPRLWHMNYSGTEKLVEEPFDLGGELGMFPRDPSFSARNRVRCHCVMGPVTDPSILELPADRKNEMRDEVLAAMEDG